MKLHTIVVWNWLSRALERRVYTVFSHPAEKFTIFGVDLRQQAPVGGTPKCSSYAWSNESTEAYDIQIR